MRVRSTCNEEEAKKRRSEESEGKANVERTMVAAPAAVAAAENGMED